MAIIPGAGYMVDPNNAGGVIPIPENPNQGGVPALEKQPTGAAPATTAFLQAMQEKAANQGKPGYDILGNPVSPPIEPAVVSSSAITDKVIPDNTQKLADYSQKGTYQDSSGKLRYADGSLVSAPTGATYNPDTGAWESGGTSYGTGPSYIDNPTNDPDIEAENKLLESLKMSGDSTLVKTVSSIQSQYDALRAEQQQQNDMAAKSRARTLLVSGESRYSPLTASGTMLAQANYGLKQIQNLNTSEDQALATAEAAHQSNDMALMDKALTSVEAIRKQKADAAATVAKQLADANAAAQKVTVQIGLDNAVASEMAKGVTDPAQILKDVNANGGTYTADDVKKSLTNLTPAKNTSSDTYNFSNTDTGKLLAAGLHADQIQAIQDYYNGKGSAPTGLTAAQTGAIQDVLTGKSAAGSSDFTSSQINKGASSAGLAIEDFKKLDADTQNYFVNTYPTSQLKKDVEAVGSAGAKNAQQIADDLSQATSVPDSVKKIIYNRLGVQPGDNAGKPQGFIGEVGQLAGEGWSGLRSLLGI